MHSKKEEIGQLTRITGTNKIFYSRFIDVPVILPENSPKVLHMHMTSKYMMSSHYTGEKKKHLI